MYKVGITGGSGFVGTNLMKYLDSSTVALTSIDRNQLNEAEFNGLNFDAVIHLAGKAHDLKKTSAPDVYYFVNFELTKKIFDAFLESSASKFIFISSVKASADLVEGVLTEQASPKPLTDYGKSKLMAEEYIQSQVLPKGKSCYILRPCMIHGPGNKGNLNLLYKVVKTGIPYPLAAFNNQRSFLSIDNLNFIIQKLIGENSIPSGIYNVADDLPLSTNEVIEIISEVEGRSAKLWEVSPSIIKFFATIGDVLHLPLNSERLKKLTESYIVSNEKIKKALDIAALPVSSNDGLVKTIQSFR